jgi:hypothetical protein
VKCFFLFRILNLLGYQLIDIEYWNRVSDKKLHCNSTNATDLCKVISDEVEK